MVHPAPPPSLADYLAADESWQRRFDLLAVAVPDDSRYLSWDELRYREPPDGLTAEQWWFGLRFRRLAAARPTGLLLRDGAPLTFVLTDELLRRAERFAARGGTVVGSAPRILTPATRDRYLRSSLREEAIASSQLEGAATTRKVAREMLETGRAPRTHGERMILGNYRSMEFVRSWGDAELTPVMVQDLHRVATEGTLEDPADAGRLQQSHEPRVAVMDRGDSAGHVVHQPPPAVELPERLARLCAFANGTLADSSYLPGLLHAITVHFMVGYDHYFVDGNGRTARALFYWAIMRHGSSLAEFLTVSTLLRNAPAQYARSFVLTEQDEGDLTHFLAYHSEIALRALDELYAYLESRQEDQSAIEQALGGWSLNHRQMEAVQSGLADPGAVFIVARHAEIHRVTLQTARADLRELEDLGLLRSRKRGRAVEWTATGDLEERLLAHQADEAVGGG